MPGQLKSYRDHARIVEADADRDAADLAELNMRRRQAAKARERFSSR